jgi:hypothetical protein
VEQPHQSPLFPLFPALFTLLFLILPLAIKAAAYVKVFQSVAAASCKVRYSRSSMLTLAIRVSRASQSSVSNPSVINSVNQQVRRQSTVSALSGLPVQERRLAAAMFGMILLSLATWCPLASSLFLPRGRFFVWSAITSLTCAVHNPLIYVIGNRKFRKTFATHFLCRCRCDNTVDVLNTPGPRTSAPGAGRPEPRWLFSAPALATINEAGSHVALAGSKHENDSECGANSSSANLQLQVPDSENFSQLKEKRERKRPILSPDGDALPPVFN